MKIEYSSHVYANGDHVVWCMWNVSSMANGRIPPRHMRSVCLIRGGDKKRWALRPGAMTTCALLRVGDYESLEFDTLDQAKVWVRMFAQTQTGVDT